MVKIGKPGTSFNEFDYLARIYACVVLEFVLLKTHIWGMCGIGGVNPYAAGGQYGQYKMMQKN